MMLTRLIVLCPGKYTPHRSLREHPFLLALRRWGRFARRNWIASSVWNFCRWVADVPPRETSPAAKSEEKRMFSRTSRSIERCQTEETEARNAFQYNLIPDCYSSKRSITASLRTGGISKKVSPGTRIPPATQDRSRRPYVIWEKWSQLLDLALYVWI